MDFQSAITANYTQSVKSPTGEVFKVDALVTRALRQDAMWSSNEVLGAWAIVSVTFDATCVKHADGGILLQPETGENFFLELCPLVGSIVQVTVNAKESQ